MMFKLICILFQIIVTKFDTDEIWNVRAIKIIILLYLFTFKVVLTIKEASCDIIYICVCVKWQGETFIMRDSEASKCALFETNAMWLIHALLFSARFFLQ